MAIIAGSSSSNSTFYAIGPICVAIALGTLVCEQVNLKGKLEMRYRNFMAALAAAALVASPMPSFAQSAPQPAVSEEEGLQLRHEPEHRRKKRTIFYILGGIAVAVAVYLLFIHDGDDDPISA